MSDITPMFQGEVQLAGWSESHNGGCKVTFWLSDPTDLDAFRVMTVRKGNTAGQRLACVLVEIGDDEQPVQQEPAAPGPAPAEPEQKGGELAKLAGMWCAAPGFWEFLNSNSTGKWTVTNAEQAAAVVRKVCRVETRAMLDHDEHAGMRFQEFIRLPYMRWQQGAR